ncbi:MAG: hypothetical protein VYD83_07835 [SAR324 cluster bacterium]|nr:hypothetical protein [SAR324 cluster bacterium]
MSRWLYMIFSILITSCTVNTLMQEINSSDSQHYVSCPPHVFYCYSKSEMICHKGYRVLTVALWEDNPEMIVECN